MEKTNIKEKNYKLAPRKKWSLVPAFKEIFGIGKNKEEKIDEQAVSTFEGCLNEVQSRTNGNRNEYKAAQQQYRAQQRNEIGKERQQPNIDDGDREH